MLRASSFIAVANSTHAFMKVRNDTARVVCVVSVPASNSAASSNGSKVASIALALTPKLSAVSSASIMCR